MESNGYRLLLPEGTLDYFIISDVKESSTEIVIYLEEKTDQRKNLRGKNWKIYISVRNKISHRRLS